MSCRTLDARKQLFLTTKLLTDIFASVVDGILVPSEVVRARGNRTPLASSFFTVLMIGLVW